VSGNRRPEEVVVVVRRPGAADGGHEYLVLLRSPEKLGYWHLVAGGVEWGEEPAAAAARELVEETGLAAEPRQLGGALSYSLAGDPESVRRRFPAGTERITVWPFVADASQGWEPVLDHEHVEARWLDGDGAVARLRYPEPREAVRRAAS
jgi:8-oxo-dGTP pyrophosphatase MutT (NUDIX family)